MSIKRQFTNNTDRTFGINNPIRQSAYGNVFSMSRTSVEKLKSRLYTVIFTNPGDRVMMPTFGCRLQEMLFEPMTGKTNDFIREEIKRAAKTWVPEVIINEVVFNNADENYENNRMDLTIKFSLVVDSSITEQIDIEMSM